MVTRAGRPSLSRRRTTITLMQLGPTDRPWLPDPSLMPGVVVESAFASSPGEGSFVLGARDQEVLALALVGALDSYFQRSGLA
jgi:hypothetical protein